MYTLFQVNQFRQLYSKVINDKHDDVMAKFGAILAQGILDAGEAQNPRAKSALSCSWGPVAGMAFRL